MVLALLIVLLSATPLEGCVAKPEGRGWAYECAGLSASIRDEPGLASYVERFHAKIPGMAEEDRKPVHAQWFRRVLAGVEEDVYRAEFPTGTEFITGLKRPQGIRIIGCTGEERRCIEVLDVLASTEWNARPPAGVVLEQAPPALLLGRAVDMVKSPSLCKSYAR